MDRKDAIAWVLSVCATSLRLSQARTLSELVAGALKVSRVSLAQIGRHLLGSSTAKHRIKRTWRFVANERVEPSEAMRAVVARLVKRHRNKPLLVALHWTGLRGFRTLMAAVVMKGRGVPRSIMLPGDARAAQRTGLAKWATRQLPGRTLTAEVTVLALRTFGPRGAEVVGEVPSPARLHGRLAHCMVYARFPAGDVKQLRQLKKGVRIRLSGVFPQGHPGLGAPLRPGRGEIEVELVGHRLGTKERVDGWSQRHAFIEISLWNCRLLK